MFEQVFLENQGRTRKPWTVCVSFLLQILLVAVMVMVPLIFTEGLPKAQLAGIFLAPGVPPPPPPPPPPPGNTVAKTPNRVVRQVTEGHLPAYTSIPKAVAMIIDDAIPAEVGGMNGGVPGGIEGGVPNGVPNGVLGAPVTAAYVPPPPVSAPPPVAVEKPKAPVRITVGGNVQEARIVNRAIPVYPPLAKQARVQGTVHLTGIIARDGTIQQLQVVGGHPLLVPAALQAVRLWRYRPTLLNGEAVEVVAPISVTFILNN